MTSNIIRQRFINYWGSQSSPVTPTHFYTMSTPNPEISFGSIKGYTKTYGASPIGNFDDNYTLSGTQITNIAYPLMNAVDIDWNEATLSTTGMINYAQINTTADLLAYINVIKQAVDVIDPPTAQL